MTASGQDGALAVDEQDVSGPAEDAKSRDDEWSYLGAEPASTPDYPVDRLVIRSRRVVRVETEFE